MAKVFTITEGLENMGALKTGGQGSVYKGRRIGEIITAVKLLPTPIHSESPDDKHFTDFQNEVHKLKRVNAKPNPNVVKILSSGITETGSLPFIEMEYVEGPDLEDLLKPPHDPVFSVKEAIRVADQLSNALSHCHQVNVKHGDVKTNNVKFNVHTGNYVLLDFGMSMMSDEQRRTSLRHAGAIEFMAPEQNEGRILFPTDVYSFGVVMFELLAGTVPFPLKDNGEMARNKVMLAHMETEPPDLLALRRERLPAHWSIDQKDAEMRVPEWLINTIYISLQKAPEKRFADGKALHDYIVLRNTKSVGGIVDTSELARLQTENEALRRERDGLQRQLQSIQQPQHREPYQPAAGPAVTYEQPRKSSTLFFALLIMGIIAGAVFLWYKYGRTRTQNSQTEIVRTEPDNVLAQYKVLAAKAYFHDQPDAATRRPAAFLVPSDAIVTASREQNGFVYTEFTNSRGQTSRGWLRKADLVPLGQWREPETAPVETDFSPEAVEQRLAQARDYLQRNQLDDAVAIYNALAEKGVPEALYESGNLGLQKRNPGMDCGKAYTRIMEASDFGYAPAKRTMGFLYYFADNPAILRINNYENCSYERNVFKGTRLLMEAVLAGDSTAKRLVEELNIGRLQPTDSTESD